MSWAQRLKRVFNINVETCHCGGAVRIVASIEVPKIIRAILDHEGPGERTHLARAPGTATPATLRLRAFGTQSRFRWLTSGRLAGETIGARPWTHAFDQTGPQHIAALADTGAFAKFKLHVVR